jgi:hypothetical protein
MLYNVAKTVHVPLARTEALPVPAV